MLPPAGYWFSGPALAAGLAFITSITTLGFSWYSAASNACEQARKAERERRVAVLERLRGYYITSHDGVTSEIMAGVALPPTDWLDQQLEALHQDWRMKDLDKLP